MNGRTETKLKLEERISHKLKNLPDYVTDYYYFLASSGLEPMSCLVYVSHIQMFLRFINEDVFSIDISKLKERDVAQYIMHKSTKEDEDGNRVESSFAQRKLIHTVLTKFFKFANKSGLISTNIMEDIARPRANDNVKRIKLDLSDFRKIMDAVEEGAGSSKAIAMQDDWYERDSLIMYMFMSTGIRLTALTEINVEDIKLEEREITVIDKRHKTHVYYIDDDLEYYIIEWLQKRTRLLGDKKSDALFISRHRKRIGGTTVKDIVAKYSEAALGYKISPHKLRAAFCTILYENTRDIEFVRQAVGHSSVSTTQRYIVSDNSAKRRSTSIISSGMNNAK